MGVNSAIFFDYTAHVNFFTLCLQSLPEDAAMEDNSKLMLLFLSLSGLELLKGLDHWPQSRKDKIIDWVYSHQIPRRVDSKGMSNKDALGFRGANNLGCRVLGENNVVWDTAHLAMTYCALLILLILGDDLSKIDRKGLLQALGNLQREDGSFGSSSEERNDITFSFKEGDMRFVYCAVVIAHILNGYSYIDIQLLCDFIKNSLSYEGSFGQGPLQEGHGGSTFCALASLHILDKLDEVLSENDKELIVRWCLFRQQSGFQGRPNKEEDTCYSFWIGCSLKILKSFKWIDKEKNKVWLSRTQRKFGGFAKYAEGNCREDLGHSYFGICALALMKASSTGSTRP
ncbi:geranylgeranyl transferase type-1 subunit beta-like isoform X2 [Zophobas morio]|uniref:geranylgeranyl transferase type-1 subunit beta-like isoform X2 n=1 Tax=Zophobas morio TaxID=2755281 RepID=UPI0030830E11